MQDDEWKRSRGVYPFFDLKLCDQAALSDQRVLVAGKLEQVLRISGMLLNRSDGLMPHNRLLFLVLNAFLQQMVGRTASHLPEHEAYLVLEQAILSLGVFLRQQLAEHLQTFLGPQVSEHVGQPILAEERNIIPKENSQISILCIEFLQMMLREETCELSHAEGRSWLLRSVEVLPVPLLEMRVAYFCEGDLAGPLQLLAGRMEVAGVEIMEFGQEVVGKCLCGLVSGEIVILLIVDH